MDRQTADRILTDLVTAQGRIAELMYALDGRRGLGFMRAGGLAGQTAAAWRRLEPEVDALWSHFTAVGEALGRAQTLRGHRPKDPEWAELTRVLTAPSLYFDAAGMPVAEAGSAATRVTVTDEVRTLEQRCAGALALLDVVDAAWSAVAAKVGPVTEAFDSTNALATELGALDRGTVKDRLRALGVRIGDARGKALADPLGAVGAQAPTGPPAGPGMPIWPAASGTSAQLATGELDAAFAALLVDIDAVRSDLAGLQRLRADYPARLAGLRAGIEEVAAAEQAVRDSYARAREKIAAVDLPEPPAGASVLRSRIVELDRLRLAGQWVRLGSELSTVEQSVVAAKEFAARMRQLADGLLERRTELRGRLDAYRAKAARLGLVEESGLSGLYDKAHALLYSAPCDLRSATQAVFAYQQELAHLLEAGNRRGTEEDS